MNNCIKTNVVFCGFNNYKQFVITIKCSNNYSVICSIYCDAKLILLTLQAENKRIVSSLFEFYLTRFLVLKSKMKKI